MSSTDIAQAVQQVWCLELLALALAALSLLVATFHLLYILLSESSYMYLTCSRY